jgi:predicted nucleotide-binding protein
MARESSRIPNTNAALNREDVGWRASLGTFGSEGHGGYRKLKLFLSWSGRHSQRLAEALREWLPFVIQAAEPWLSSTDIEAGSRWASEVALQLQQARVGILCLTPENLTAPWLLFEAGALSKALESTFICPYLLGFSPSELKGPLVQFQAVTADKDGTRKLVLTLNRALGESSMREDILQQTFELWWPKLEDSLEDIGASLSSVIHRKEGKEQAGGTLETGSTTTLREPLTEVARLIAAETSSRASDSDARQRVFIIHGHNVAVRESVARFIERLGPAVIILSEQPNMGRTIIEKFESYSGVDFAVALMTADDVHTKDTQGAQPQKRARQNVIFELGFFAAKLGRSRLAVLFEDGVEMPSDFSGIVYIQIDPAGAWKFQLARELKIAGLRIDLNQAL